MRHFIFFFLFFTTQQAMAQRIYGTVYSDNGDLLPFSSITIKGTTNGVAANSSAKYALNLSAGNYTVVCHHIGYAFQEKKVTLKEGETAELTFVLPLQKYFLKEVIVKKGEDASYAIIRNAIRMRPYYNSQITSFECDLYCKNTLKLEQMPERILGKKITKEDKQGDGLDSTGKGIVYLDETISRLSFQRPQKLKMEVKSSHVSGSNSFGFAFPAFISFYQNNVTVFSTKLNPRGFISPIADNAMRYYIYRFIGSYFENGIEVNSILVIPKRKYEPLFSGIINIMENSWRIHSTSLSLTKTSQLEILDSLVINQLHIPVNDSVWVVKNQLLHIKLNPLGVGINGNFVNVYSGYTINPEFGKRYFGSTIIKYDSTKYSSEYWEKTRPVPMEAEEVSNYHLRDSLSRNPVVLKKNGSSKKTYKGWRYVKDVFWNGTGAQNFSDTIQHTWQFSPLLKGLEYNPAEGLVTNINGTYSQKIPHSSHDISFNPSLRYGFANTHLDPALNIQIRTSEFESTKKLKSELWNMSFGKRVTQFNNQCPITPLVNSLSTLLYGDNLMKTYENSFASVEFNKQYESGFKFFINTLYEDRTVLDNVSSFTFFEKNKVKITPNYPLDKLSSQFVPHQAFIINAEASFRPGQRYIEFPDRKISLGSKYPTFTINFSKGLKNILGSDEDFDKWKLSVTGDKNFKIAGLMRYKISVGGFLNTNSVYIQDYQHFNGNLSVIASDYLNSFQLSSYYANSTTASLYGILHIEHHFNGLLTNKIPGLKNWNWNLVAGTNSFYVNQQSNHIEFFAGLENILKIFRVDWVTAFENGKPVRSDVRIGYGGLLSSSVQKKGNAIKISL